MNPFYAFILGIIQGLTEFIPVSSTAHLLIGQRLMGLVSDDYMFAFLVIIQLGTLVSLFIFYWKDLLTLAKAFFARPFSTPENKLAWYILIATIPAAVIGFLLRHVVEELFKQPLLEAAVRLLAAAILMALAEWLGKRTRTLDSMRWFDALIIGVFQVIAVFPGASRSGTTISGGMLRGFDRPAAARFGFLMSIPIMLGAGGYQMLDVFSLPGLAQLLPAIAIGFITAAVVGWFSICWLLVYLSRNSLYLFAAYCAVAGIICAILFRFLA